MLLEPPPNKEVTIRITILLIALLCVLGFASTANATAPPGVVFYPENDTGGLTYYHIGDAAMDYNNSARFTDLGWGSLNALQDATFRMQVVGWIPSGTIPGRRGVKNITRYDARTLAFQYVIYIEEPYRKACAYHAWVKGQDAEQYGIQFVTKPQYVGCYAY
jgi:hypothetical protein